MYNGIGILKLMKPIFLYLQVFREICRSLLSLTVVMYVCITVVMYVSCMYVSLLFMFSFIHCTKYGMTLRFESSQTIDRWNLIKYLASRESHSSQHNFQFLPVIIFTVITAIIIYRGNCFKNLCMKGLGVSNHK